MRIKEKHIARYGSVNLLRRYCMKCEKSAFVINNVLQCCDTELKENLSKRQEIMVPRRGNRKKRPTLERQRELLKEQDNKCIYCNQIFGSPYIKNGKVRFLKVHFDHLIPFSYSQTSKNVDFLASCNICNAIKGSKIFATIEDIIHYVQYWRQKRGYLFYENI